DCGRHAAVRALNGEATGCARVSARGPPPKAPFPERHNETVRSLGSAGSQAVPYCPALQNRHTFIYQWPNGGLGQVGGHCLCSLD
uniref:Uncharacterized protein n=1 Tax=Hucho hucho TaxID=62062 RepID=A0A4W5PM32_9TELE